MVFLRQEKIIISQSDNMWPQKITVHAAHIPNAKPKVP